MEKKKTGQIKAMISMKMLILSYIIQQIIPNVLQNFKILGEVALEISLKKYFIEDKEEWTNKKNGKIEKADSFLHDTGDRTQCL